MKHLLLVFTFLCVYTTYAQTFYRGNDLSYTNQMEDCGAKFKEKGVNKDVYQIFADHGTNLVRIRLWHNPTWQNTLAQPAGVKTQYSDFADAKKSIKRAKDAGMSVMLDLPLSDFWADPAAQLIPAAWVKVSASVTDLSDSVYNYVKKILTDLNKDNLMPEIVKLGNENNGGILRHTTLNADYTVSGSISTDWARHAKLYNAGIKAIRDVSAGTTIKSRIALHFSGLTNLSWWYQNIITNGVTDFDIIGFSYYYAWHSASIATLESTITSLKSTFPKYDVMVAETGYLWTTQNFDAMANIINTPDPAYLPVIPEKQLEYMVDYTRAVKRAGGIGVVFWEPAWVSTPCRTPWGVGSSHDHVAFFDPVNTNFMDNGGGNWMKADWYQDITTKKVSFKVDMNGQDVSKGVFITGTMTGGKILRMTNEGSGIYSYFTYLSTGSEGSYFFMNDSSLTARETVPTACALMNATDRKYTVSTTDLVLGNTWATCLPLGNATKVKVTFKVDMTGQSVANGVYVTGTWTGTNWVITPMTSLGNNIYSYQTQMSPGDKGAYYFMNQNTWGKRETVPSACATWWNTDRGYEIGKKDTVYFYKWGTCDYVLTSLPDNPNFQGFIIYPNPTSNLLKVVFSNLLETATIDILDIQGKKIGSKKVDPSTSQAEFDFSAKPKGVYLLRITSGRHVQTQKIAVN